MPLLPVSPSNSCHPEPWLLPEQSNKTIDAVTRSDLKRNAQHTRLELDSLPHQKYYEGLQKQFSLQASVNNAPDEKPEITKFTALNHASTRARTHFSRAAIIPKVTTQKTCPSPSTICHLTSMLPHSSARLKRVFSSLTKCRATSG